ncbi:protein FAR-RED ELONGATED HYPOCOTYL 3-like [Chenopodium quinoa]|uniref:protein FAR-RED ELONGATED HYPOCOTYL 3-like n=1 Tax=Chenopodium quinoa TaxID=63459 RepID=UPI000B798884|nr:protein FAR-RED ELONGATED HYPOCOTYL 3-like [Chenopodium quinoa]
MKEYFWAGMKTTQRVESIDSFFDGFVNYQTKLFEFPLKYSIALKKRARDEADADANCSKYVRRLISGFEVEKLFQKVYTDTKFQEVQTECARMMYYFCREEKFISETVVQYILEDRVWIVPKGMSEEKLTDPRRFLSTTFNNVTKEVVCDCKKFVTDGIMCKHMFRILDQNHVFEIPETYIVYRWRKDISRKHTRVKVEYHDPSESVEVKRYNRLMTAFEGLCDEAVMVNEETVELVLQGINQMRVQVEGLKQKKLRIGGLINLRLAFATSGKSKLPVLRNPNVMQNESNDHRILKGNELLSRNTLNWCDGESQSF